MKSLKPNQFASSPFSFSIFLWFLLVGCLHGAVDALQPHQRTWLTADTAAQGSQLERRLAFFVLSTTSHDLFPFPEWNDLDTRGLHKSLLKIVLLSVQRVLPSMISKVTGLWHETLCFTSTGFIASSQCQA
jgi:hypothetical protein